MCPWYYVYRLHAFIHLLVDAMCMLVIVYCILSEGVDLDYTKELEANFCTEDSESGTMTICGPILGEPRLMPLHCNCRTEYETSFVRTSAKKPPSFSLMFLARVLTELVETEEALLMAEVVLVEKLLQRELVTVNRIYNVLR